MQIYTVARSQEVQKGGDAIMLLTVGTGCVAAMGGGGVGQMQVGCFSSLVQRVEAQRINRF